MADLYGQLESGTRQRRLADLLRKRAMETEFQGDPGRMVSGHYVAPSWAQGLNQVISPLMAQQQARQAEAQAAAQEQALNQATTQARAKWQSALPQAIAAQAERAGPVDPNNPTELAATPAQPVTTERILRHTLEGMNIPGNEKAAELYNRGSLADLTREDTQVARREESQARIAADVQKQVRDKEARLEELRIRNEDRALDRDSREQMAREARSLQAEIARGNQELRRLGIQTQKQIAEVKATAEKPPKALPAAQSKAWIENSTAMKKAQRALDYLVDEKGEIKPEASGDMGLQYMIPFSEEAGQRLDPGGVPLRAAIADVGSLKIHDRSGAAVPAAEAPRLKPFVPSAADTPKAAAAKLKNFITEYTVMQQEILDYAETQGYKSPVSKESKRLKFNPATGELE